MTFKLLECNKIETSRLRPIEMAEKKISTTATHNLERSIFDHGNLEQRIETHRWKFRNRDRSLFSLHKMVNNFEFFYNFDFHNFPRRSNTDDTQ